MKEFAKWDSAAAAISEIDKLIDGKVPPILAGLIEKIKDEKKITLAVADKNLGASLQKLPGLNITPIPAGPGSLCGEIYRGIREHLAELIPGIQADNFKTMSLGLSHSLSRHKLKFSADKVDIMIIQSVNLLDDLDKELNTYAMRVKEWYGWHFPELSKILNDNLAYARVILTVGMRENLDKANLSEILPEEIETAVKAAAEVSMGTEIGEEDLENIRLLAEQVVSYSEYRITLSSYLDARMRAIAPNLTALVGYLVGARLIAHAGSLMSLAKSAGSTIQILGAEKALFRALKTKHATPKYGLIYHSSLVGQATGKNKGKIARQLASKAALGVRTDALEEFGEEADEDERAALGTAARVRLENNLRRLEGKPLLARGVAIGPNGAPTSAPGKWDIKEARKYNADADGLAGDEPAAATVAISEGQENEGGKKSKKEKKEKKKGKKAPSPEPNGDDEEPTDDEMTDALNGSAGNVPSSPTVSTVSDDTEDPPEAPQENRQSSITGATRQAKRPDKKERHERALELAPERATKRAERRDRKEQQERHANRVLGLPEAPHVSSQPTSSQPAEAGKLSEAEYEQFAKIAGISVTKFKRKFDRGDVDLGDDGKPVVHSKKELKKLRKAQEAASEGGKRKRDDDDEKPKKKKKKHHEA